MRTALWLRGASLADHNADQALGTALANGHELSEHDSRAITDGQISFEEYEQAVFRFRECMETNGTPLYDFAYSDDLRRYDWTVPEEYLSDSRALACEDDFSLIDTLWQAQVETELEPEREARRVKVIECMRRKGAEVDAELPYPDVMMRAASKYPECIDEGFEK